MVGEAVKHRVALRAPAILESFGHAQSVAKFRGEQSRFDPGATARQSGQESSGSRLSLRQKDCTSSNRGGGKLPLPGGDVQLQRQCFLPQAECSFQGEGARRAKHLIVGGQS